MAASPQLDGTRTVSSGRLIYDGDCGFCTATAKWVSSRSENVQILPWQSQDLESLGLSVSDVSTAAYWIDESGKSFRGHLAFGKSLRQIGGPMYATLGWLMFVWPFSLIGRLAYRLIARYRHKLPGSTDACRLYK